MLAVESSHLAAAKDGWHHQEDAAIIRLDQTKSKRIV
jgi:hypothetical protein